VVLFRTSIVPSDPGPIPRTSGHIAEELRTALHRASIAELYILVGHSFGGDNLRTFADLYMCEVAGLVLVDADPATSESKSMRGERHVRLAVNRLLPRFSVKRTWVTVQCLRHLGSPSAAATIKHLRKTLLSIVLPQVELVRVFWGSGL
jgi:pimeloyl-ACP methyl ester carboxylesterase